MKGTKAVGFVVVGLVAGLVLGSLGIASAVTQKATTPNAPLTAGAGAVCGVDGGLRIGPAMRDAGGRLIDVVAKLTGLSVTDVATQRASGTSYAKIAESKGVSSEKVVEEALAARKAILDAKVKDGTITSETEQAMLDRMESNIKTRVESTDAQRGGCGGGRGGRAGAGRGMMRGGGACNGACGGTGQATGTGATTTAPTTY